MQKEDTAERRMIIAIKYDNCKDCHSRCKHAGKGREFICINGVSCKITKEKQQSNADRIRSMTDDELNDLFNEIYNAGVEDAVAYEWGQRTNSFEWTMEWLQQPAEGE